MLDSNCSVLVNSRSRAPGSTAVYTLCNSSINCNCLTSFTIAVDSELFWAKEIKCALAARGMNLWEGWCFEDYFKSDCLARLLKFCKWSFYAFKEVDKDPMFAI